MKSFLLAILLMVSGSALALDQCYSGSYYDPETPGWGIDVQITDEVVVAYHYGYLGGRHMWWVGVGANEGDSIVLEAFQTYQGGSGEYVVGSMEFTPTADGALFKFSYQLDVTREGASIPWCLSSQCNGEYELAHLLQPNRSCGPA